MKTRRIETGAEPVHVLVFDPGDDVSAGLLNYAKEQNLTAARFTGIGALSQVTLGFFDLETKDYLKNEIREQVELLSLVGNIAEYDGKPKVHAHVVVGKRDGTAYGGHLLKGTVRPTLEVTLIAEPAHLKRKTDPATGLALLDPTAEALPPRTGRES
jgi:predicted DNA-binding protein with PD1-like motif